MGTIHEDISSKNGARLCFHSAAYAQITCGLQESTFLMPGTVSSQSPDGGADLTTGIYLQPACSLHLQVSPWCPRSEQVQVRCCSLPCCPPSPGKHWQSRDFHKHQSTGEPEFLSRLFTGSHYLATDWDQNFWQNTQLRKFHVVSVSTKNITFSSGKYIMNQYTQDLGTLHW